MTKSPKLRTVQKYKPPYPLNNFPASFALDLGREVIYLIASRGKQARLEGSDWEEIFARLIGARWKPSNVGLDDIILQQTAWGAKTVKNPRPSTTSKVRLISGRNSPVYSFGDSEISEVDPDQLGEKTLAIWNERVTGIRKLYRHVRTIVLIKSNDLLELAVFEFDTIIYPAEQFGWRWNRNNNLEGFNKTTDQHIFTWQPHGSQFTIIESVPEERLAIKIKEPPQLDKDVILGSDSGIIILLIFSSTYLMDSFVAHPETGAENLLMRGDMLVRFAGRSCARTHGRLIQPGDIAQEVRAG